MRCPKRHAKSLFCLNKHGKEENHVKKLPLSQRKMEVWGRPPGHGGGQGPTGKKWIYVSKIITLKKILCVKTRYTNFGKSKGYAFGKFSFTLSKSDAHKRENMFLRGTVLRLWVHPYCLKLSDFIYVTLVSGIFSYIEWTCLQLGKYALDNTDFLALKDLGAKKIVTHIHMGVHFFDHVSWSFWCSPPEMYRLWLVHGKIHNPRFSLRGIKLPVFYLDEKN